MPYKNTAVTVTLTAWDTINNIGKTGESGNITVRAVGDGTEFTPGTPSITEVDSTNLKGVYSVSLSAGENNYSFVTLGGVCSTAGIAIIPVSWSNESDANTVKVSGTTQTGRDIGASVLLSSGTGAGQIDFTSGIVKSNLTQILGTLLTETSGLIAAGFKKFFNVATPTGTLNSLPDAVPGQAGGLPTTNGTKVNQTVDLTAGQSIACSDKTGFSLSATGADLITKTSTFAQAIVAAINEFATYGLTALNTLLVTTGIKAASIPDATIGGYATGQDPATLLLVTPANKISTDSSNCVKVPDTQKVDVNTIKTKVVTVDSGGTTFPASVASPTNITDGTITTVTNLSNAPTAGDFTATMKASLNAAVPGSGSGSVPTPLRILGDDSLPIADVDVTIRASSVSTDPVIANGKTDSFGYVVPQPNLDPGNYYLWRQKSEYNFSDDPYSFTVI